MFRLGILFVLILTFCSKAYALDPEYNQSCYGGNYLKHLNSKSPLFSVALDIKVEDWSNLKTSFENFADKNSLEYFDTGVISEDYKKLSLSICSNTGIFINTIKRMVNHPLDVKYHSMPLMIHMTAYKENENAKEIIKELKYELMQQWGEKATVDHDVKTTFR